MRKRLEGQERPQVARAEARQAAFAEVRAHELFGPLLRRIHPDDVDTWGVRTSALGREGLLAVDAHGGLVFNGRATAAPGTWTWSLCHVLSHLGFGHADPGHRDGRGSYTPEWRAACCLVVNRFLGTLGIPGTPVVPSGFDEDEDALAHRFAAVGIPTLAATAGPAGSGPDLWENLHERRQARSSDAASVWARTFATGLATFDGGALACPGRLASPAAAAPAVRALAPPPAPWDVRFTAWFDERFPAPPADASAERRARRRSPLELAPPPAASGATTGSFGVVVDTSGSMDEALLERALDAVASSATARDVRRARVVFCSSASPHDAGWLAPEQIAGRVQIRDRRGAVLQPGVDLLLTDRTFPPDEPILLITDGRCDQVRLRRDHAWLTSGTLPFTPAGPVFHVC